MKNHSQTEESQLSQSQLAQLKLELLQVQSQLSNAKQELTDAEEARDAAQVALATTIKAIDVRNEKAQVNFMRHEKGYKSKLEVYPHLIKQLEVEYGEVVVNIKDSIQELEELEEKIAHHRESLQSVTNQSEDLQDTVTANRAELDKMKSEYNMVKDDLNQGSLKIVAQRKDIEDRSAELKKLKEELDELKADYKTRKSRVEDDMKVTIQRSIDVTERLKQLQNHEQKLNQDIATRIKAVDDREDAIKKKESKLLGGNKDFMKL